MQTTSITLRTLWWPELPRVDLTREFYWIVRDDDEDNVPGGGDCELGEPTAGAADYDIDDSPLLNEQIDSGAQYQKNYASLSNLEHSPYRQQLQHSKEKRPPLSPARRAAKKILKLKLELGCLENDDVFVSSEHYYDPEQQHQQAGEGDQLGDSIRQFQKNRQQKAKNQPISTTQPTTRKQLSRVAPSSKPSPPLTNSAMKEEVRIAKLPVQASAKKMAMTCRSAATSSLSLWPPSNQSQPSTVKKTKKRPETKEQRDLRELHEKQKRLADWLTANTSSNEKDHGGDHVAYSMEVESRIHHAMEATRDKGLWGDPIASLIASEMTSESVFGGFISTRRLAFSTTTSEPTSTINSAQLPVLPLEPLDMANSGEDTARIEIPVHETTSSSLIHERALEIRQEAQQLVHVGNIEDALATLQNGIKQLLFDFQDNQDEIQTAGFNFSQDAHAKAAAVQLKYKARHRKRVQKIAFLQKVWRDYQVKKRCLDTKRFKAESARVIQRQYKQRFFRNQRIKAAVRIQNCFRIFQEQKLWVCLHRACRMLTNDERKKRERIRRYQAMKKRLWDKLVTVLRMLWLWKSRFRALTQIQKQWRGSRARVEYAKLLVAQCEVEQLRLNRELAFVEPHLDQALVLYHQFLTRTRAGKRLVRWQMNKPWLRFKRLRRQDENGKYWHGLELKTKAQALCGLLVKKNRLGTRQLRAFGHLLGVESSQVLNIRQEAADVSVESLVTIYESLLLPSKPVAGLADGGTPVRSSQSKPVRLKRWFNKCKAMWINRFENWKQSLSCSLLLFYWCVVLWPLSYLVDRNSSKNRQRAMRLLEQQQRFVLTKHLRLVYRQLDPTAKGNRPNFACEYCSEPFATAHACNLHLHTCKQRHSEQLLEWETIQQDIAYLAAQQNNRSRQPSSSLLLSKTTTPQEYLDFSTFQLESGSLKQLLLESEKSWRLCISSNNTRKALQMLVEMAVCCGVDSPSGGTLQGRQVALELVAFLLLPLPRTSSSELLHPLAAPQLHAFVDWKPMGTQDPSPKSEAIGATSQSQWISEKELFAKLLLSKPTTGSSWSVGRFMAIATRAASCWWQRAKTWVHSVSSSSKYRQHLQASSSTSATVLPVA